MIVTKATGFARFYHATRYSMKGIRAAYISEPAFRYESWIVALMAPASFFVANTGFQWGVMIASLLLVLVMELLNTAIEAIVDRAGTEFHALAGLAKDLGSAAVFFALFIVAVVWGGIIWDNFLS
ncbi:diacylglycerol kinase [Marinobacterium lutimaris]|uniref:Diacylglycerol kinase n=1 Tax=Marinobacterium lutimaris TaxID=568106 RepID=A0A1H5XQX8_9GAMM|nr:diacylglycerol kinase [Marinobacterium lutimaris]SEG14199.1 diacylglycerol kinase [Marinobacterium lutimaris]